MLSTLVPLFFQLYLLSCFLSFIRYALVSLHGQYLLKVYDIFFV